MFSKIRSTKTAASFLVFVTVVFSPWLSATAKAQVAGATLSGTVTDQSGGVIPQASISAKNVATGITRASTASSAGFYLAPNLLPGIYDVTVTAQGFSTEIRTGIELTVGEQRANFAIPPIALLRTDIFDASGTPSLAAGVLNSTTTPGREIQFALKFGW